MFIVDRSMACSVTCEWTELSDSVPFYCKTTAKYLQFAVFSTIAPIEALKVKLNALLGDYDIPRDRLGHREVSKREKHKKKIIFVF